MRGMGRRGGSSGRDLTDQLRPGASSEDQEDYSHHDDRDTRSPSIARPAVLSGHAYTGSSSSSAPTRAGGTSTSPMDDLALTIGSVRPRIVLMNEMLYPSDICARKITFIFKEKFDDNGYCWKNVSKQTKDFYWNEFQKHFVWDGSISSQVKIAWQRKAAKRYRALMCNLRKGKEKTMHVSESAWKIWNEAWNSLEFKSKSMQFTANRRSETGGPGTGISRHTRGSISHIRHAERLRSRLGQEPRPFELFEVTHTKKGTSELVDARAQAIKDRYLELLEQSSQTQEGQSEPPILDEVAIYYQAVGGEKKRRVYGVGSQALVFYSQSSQGSSSSKSSESLKTEIRELRETVDRLQERDQQRDQLMHQMQERDQQRDQMMHQMQAMMAKMHARLFPGLDSPTQDSHPTSDDHDVDDL